MVAQGKAAHPIGGAGPSPSVRQIDSTMPTMMNIRMTNKSSFVANSECKKFVTIAVMGGLQVSTIGGDIGFDRRLWHH
jgi:hypothetical protein